MKIKLQEGQTVFTTTGEEFKTGFKDFLCEDKRVLTEKIEISDSLLDNALDINDKAFNDLNSMLNSASNPFYSLFSNGTLKLVSTNRKIKIESMRVDFDYDVAKRVSDYLRDNLTNSGISIFIGEWSF